MTLNEQKEVMATSPILWLRRRTLVIVLLVGCAMLALLVREQGLVIESQRRLIRDLYRDSAELTLIKLENAHQKRRP